MRGRASSTTSATGCPRRSPCASATPRPTSCRPSWASSSTPTATVDRAYGAGRVEARLLPYMWSESVDPVLIYPKKLTLPKKLATLEQKPRNAKPVIQDDGTVGVVPAEDGLVYDDAAIAARHRPRRPAAATARSRSHRSSPSRPSRRPQPRAPRPTPSCCSRSRSRSPTRASKIGADHAAGARAAAEGQARRHRRSRSASRRSGCATRSPKDAADISRPAVNAHWKTDGAKARIVKHKNGRGIDGAKTGDAMLAAVLTGGSHTAAVTLGPVDAVADDRRRPRARHPREDLVRHDRPRRLVGEPGLQRAADGQVPRRPGDQARPDVLVQQARRPADAGARVQGGPGHRRRAAAAVHRRRCLPGRDDRLRRRLLRRAADQVARQPRLVHLALRDGHGRHRRRRRPRPACSRTTRSTGS